MQNDTSSITKQAPLTVYDGSGRDRLSLHAWRVMFHELWEFRELIHRLVLRDFTTQVRQSFLGYVWIALPPLASAFIFSAMRSAGIMNIEMDETDMPYPIFSLVGVTVWGFFTQFVSAAMGSIAAGGNLVSKVYFPREVLVLSGIGKAFINSMIRVVVIGITCVTFLFMPHWQVIYVIVLLIPMLAMAIGLGMLFAPINTMMRDMSRLVEFIFTFGMFMVPTIYKTPDIAQATGWQLALYWVHTLNPITYFINATRDLMQTGSFVLGPGLIASSILGFLILAIGWRIFHICEPLLAERL